MYRKLLMAAAVTAVYAVNSLGVNVFPSISNPAGKPASEVPQYITLIWDDNAYSGLNGSYYETAGDQKYADVSWVGGKYWSGWNKQWDTKKNDLNVNEGDMGMSWAVRTLGEGQSSHISGKVPMTFNVISGQFVEQFYKEGQQPDGTTPITDLDGDGYNDMWAYRQSKYGHYIDSTAYAGQKISYAIVWGREQAALDTYSQSDTSSLPLLLDIFKEAQQAGHEIGNHTVDHMESNSNLPNDEKGFGKWGGEGFDLYELDTLPWGVYDEVEEFGEANAGPLKGWKMYSGKVISKNAWKGAIDLSAEELDNYLGMTVGGSGQNQIAGFRAPRLEVNSNMFFALSESNYMYDCGLEEGYEVHRDGKNFLWPYTTDNGSYNTWTQKDMGERVMIDSMPAGLWQLPVNVVIVPEADRQAVWNQAKAVADGSGDPMESYDEWSKTGKITGFDFNMFILWSMSKAQWLNAMKHTLQLRLDGNRAPFHYGVHTDYYTPVYDFGTLSAEFNKTSYGLCLDHNQWDTRTEAVEEFIGWAQQQSGVQFVTGKKLVEELENLKSQAPDVSNYTPYYIHDIPFELYINETLTNKTTSTIESFNGSAFDVEISVAAPEGDNYPYAAYQALFSPGDITELEYISLKYKATSPLVIRLTMEDGTPSRQVLLNNLNTRDMVESGLIHISAFDYSSDEDPANIDYSTAIDPTKITAIEIQPLAPSSKPLSEGEIRTEPWDITFSTEGFMLYGNVNVGGITTPITENSNIANKLGIKSLTKSALNLNIGKAGKYNVSLFGANGRMIKSFDQVDLKAGSNNLNLNNLSSGIYMIKVKGIDSKVSMVKTRMVM